MLRLHILDLIAHSIPTIFNTTLFSTFFTLHNLISVSLSISHAFQQLSNFRSPLLHFISSKNIASPWSNFLIKISNLVKECNRINEVKWHPHSNLFLPFRIITILKDGGYFNITYEHQLSIKKMSIKNINLNKTKKTTQEIHKKLFQYFD